MSENGDSRRRVFFSVGFGHDCGVAGAARFLARRVSVVLVSGAATEAQLSGHRAETRSKPKQRFGFLSARVRVKFVRPRDSLPSLEQCVCVCGQGRIFYTHSQCPLTHTGTHTHTQTIGRKKRRIDSREKCVEIQS